MELSHYLFSLRRAARLTRVEWARRCGVSSMSVWRWETGRAIPHEHELNAALAIRGVTVPERLAAYALREEGQLPPVHPPVKRSAIHRGDLLRALRHRKGWTLEETARTLGISRCALTRWESDKTWPTAKRMHRVAVALGAQDWELVALTAPLKRSI